MKTTVISLLAILMMGTTKAQLAEFLDFGIKTGINYNTLKSKNLKSTIQSDWHLGAYIQLRGKKFGLGAEAIMDRGTYELKNLVVDAYNRKYLGDTSENSAMLRLHKFQLPIYMLYKASIFWLQLGVLYELNLSLKDRQEYIKEARELFQNSYPSLLTGVWLDVTKKINVGIRYQISLEKINSELLRTQWHSREAQLHLGIGLGRM